MKLPKKLGSLLMVASLVFGLASFAPSQALAQDHNTVIVTTADFGKPFDEKPVNGKSAASDRVDSIFGRSINLIRLFLEQGNKRFKLDQDLTTATVNDPVINSNGTHVTRSVTVHYGHPAFVNVDDYFNLLYMAKDQFDAYSDTIKDMTFPEWVAAVQKAQSTFHEKAIFSVRTVAPEGYVCTSPKKLTPEQVAMGDNYGFPLHDDNAGRDITCSLTTEITEDYKAINKVLALPNQEFHVEIALIPRSERFNKTTVLFPLPAKQVVELPQVDLLKPPTVKDISPEPANPYPAGTPYQYQIQVTNNDSRPINVSPAILDGFATPWSCDTNPIPANETSTCSIDLPVPVVPASKEAFDVKVSASLVDNTQKADVIATIAAKDFKAAPLAPSGGGGGPVVPAGPAVPTTPAETPVIPAETPVTPAEAPDRIRGSNRILTAQEIFKKAGWTAKKAILANGETQVDAATSSPYASAIGAGILLTSGKTLEQENLDFIKAQGINDVTIAGGTAAVSEAVETALKEAGVTVSRIGGANRFLTSHAFVNKVKELKPRVTTLFVTQGGSVLDALAIAPAATKNQAVIVLVDDNNGLPAEMKTFNNYTIIGNNAIANVEKDGALTGSVIKLPGATASETNVAIAKAYFANEVQAYVANSDTVADALAVGPLADKTNSPVFYVTKDAIAPNTAKYLENSKITMFTIVGGEAVISKNVENMLIGVKTPAKK